MGGKSSSAPTAPDPTQTAAAQQQANIGTARVNARLNRVNQENPYYSTTYTDMGDRTKNPDGTPIETQKKQDQQQQQQTTAQQYYPQDPNSNEGAGNSVDANPGNGPGSSNSTGEAAYGDTPMARTKAGGDPVVARSNAAPQADYVGRLNWDAQGNPTVPGSSTTTTQQPAPAASSGKPNDPNDPLAGEQAYYNQDRWKQVTTLNPEEQKILDQQRGLTLQGGGMLGTQLGRVNEALGTKLDFSNLPGMVGALNGDNLQNVDLSGIQSAVLGAGQGVRDKIGGAGEGLQSAVAGSGQGIRSDYRPTDAWSFDDTGQVQTNLSDADYGQQRQSVEDALYGKATSRLDPAFAQRERQERQMLADKGLVEGSEAYNAELDRLSRDRNDAYGQARNDAILAGGNEQSRLFGMDLSRFNAENAAQGQQFGQTSQQRAQRYAEEGGLADFANKAQEQGVQQGFQSAALKNAAQAQGFGQQAQEATFGNQAQEQKFGQGVTAGTFQNAAQNQRVQQQGALRGQQVSEQQVNAQLAQLARQQGISEAELLRSLPIKDLTSLVSAMNGGG